MLANWSSLRLTWEPRMLSISRIMLGLLFMEHGTAKVLDFPHQETHKTFALLYPSQFVMSRDLVTKDH